MSKLTKTVIVLGFLGIILSSCSSAVNNTPANKAQNQPSEVPLTVDQIESDILLIENNGISVTGALQKDAEIIVPITVHIDDKSKTYQWQNVADPEYYPKLIVDDLNQDQQDEIYLFLTKGYGTGVIDTQIHILRKDFSEITAPNPSVDLKDKLQSSVEEIDSEQHYTLKLQNKTYTYTFKHDEAAMWFEEVVVGKTTTYRIENGQLIVSLSLQVAPTLTIGMLEMSYELQEKQFKLAHIKLV